MTLETLIEGLAAGDIPGLVRKAYESGRASAIRDLESAALLEAGKKGTSGKAYLRSVAFLNSLKTAMVRR